MLNPIHDEGFSLPRSGIKGLVERFLKRMLLSSAHVPDAVDYRETPLTELLPHCHNRVRLYNWCLYASWNFGPDTAQKIDVTEIKKMIGIRHSSAESVDLVPVGLGSNVVSWYDEPELQKLRHLDDNWAHSVEKVTPANDPVELGPTTPFRVPIYDSSPTSRPQVSHDKTIFVIEGESEVVITDGWEVKERKLSIPAPSSPQSEAGHGDLIESHPDGGLVFERIVLLLFHRWLSIAPVEYVGRSTRLRHRGV